MKNNSNNKRKTVSFFNRSTAYKVCTICIALCLGCSAAFFSYTDSMKQADELITNFIYKYNPLEKADNRIVIVAIDDESIEQLGDVSDWSYNLYASAVEILDENDAAVIGLDVDLINASDDNSANEALVTAVEEAGNVVIPVNTSFYEKKDNNYIVITDEQFKNSQPIAASDSIINMDAAVRLPFDELSEVATLGAVNAVQQSLDGSVRNSLLSVESDNQTFDVFSVAVYKLYQESIGEEWELPELNKFGTFAFNSLWNTNQFTKISFTDLLNGDFDSDLLKGKIVLVGEYNESDYKNFNYTSAKAYINGRSQYQELTTTATIIQALLSTDTVVDVDSRIQSLVYGIFIALFYLIFAARRKLVALIGQVIFLNVFTGFFYEMNNRGYRFMILVPILFTILSIMVLMAQNLILQYVEKKRMEATFKMYVDSKVVDQIGSAMPYELSSLSERRNVAVLFVDIRGFTTMSEHMDPQLVVDMLNEYFTLVYASIESWNGTIDKFIGDAVMALFNAPNEDADYVFHAVCAADDIQKGFVAITEKYRQLYGTEIHAGVGVNCGEAIVGNIGCHRRMDYTAIGDTVNTASRLESKAAPDQILISESVKLAIEDRVEAKNVGALTLKGKSAAVEAYEIAKINKPKAPNLRAGKEIIREACSLYSQIGSNRELPEFFKKV